jgi:phosphotransacetylase
VRRSNTLIGALSVHLGDADAMFCGMVGRLEHHLEHVRDVIGCREGQGLAALNAPLLPGAKAPVHVLTPSATVRRIVNMTALVSATSASGRPTPPRS